MPTKEKGPGRKKALEAEFSEIQKQSDELRERLAYMQADFENYKKHFEKQKDEVEKRANEGLIRELLSVLDDLDSAIEKNKNDESKKGIELIRRNLLSVLEKRGLKAIEAKGKKLDPYYHDAMICVPSEEEGGTVLEELQKGYMLGPNVIRHSKVKVAK